METGQTKIFCATKQKAEIVHKHMDEHIYVRTSKNSITQFCSMICHWVKKYIAEGEISLVHKWHPGNKFAALHFRKKLSKIGRLRLIVAKLEIENERLKNDIKRIDLAQTRHTFQHKTRIRDYRKIKR